MRKYLLLILLFCMVTIPTYSHHGEQNILDTLVAQSVRNYVVSLECVYLLNECGCR